MKPAYQEVMEWAQDELQNGNRIKAAHIQKAAERMKVAYDNEQERLMRIAVYFQ